MAERGYPMDGGSGAVLTEPDWGAMASLWQDDGVADAPPGTALSVVSEEVPGVLKVRAGRASFRGFHYVLDEDMELSYNLNTDTSQWRTDSIVLRLDLGTNKLAIAIKEGVVGGSRPTPDVGGPTPEMELAFVNVPPNSGAVPAAQVGDQRQYISRRIRVSASGRETYPDGTIFYNAQAGRFYARIRPSGSNVSEVSPVPKFREVIAEPVSGSSDYPDTTSVGRLVWDESLKQLVAQTSWETPTWVPVGGDGKFRATKRRGGDSQITVTTAEQTLTIPIDRTGTFTFEGVIFYRHGTAGGTCGLQVTFPPMGVSGRGTVAFEYHNGSSTTSLRMASIVANGTLGPFGAPATGTTYSCRVYGSFTTTGASSLGSLGLTYTNPSGTVTIVNGSYLTVSQL
ncbi:hypothetical protein [Nonomuraea rubra]|uniref:hypothetical protein n=1 Tax=Nonomuraea rubra TaxID=46180 RepID=UPI0033D0CD33